MGDLNKKEIKHKIYISVSGEGYGHSSRALALAKRFNPDEIILGSYGYALERMEKTSYQTIEINPEISFVGKDGSFDIGLTILKNSSWPVVINQFIREEKKIIQNYGVTCVVSDSRSAPVFAAHKLGIPCILLTNQTTLAPFFETELKNLEDSLIEKSFRDWLRTGTQAVLTNATEPFVLKVVKDWLKSCDEIFIPDLSPPYSVSLPLLCGESYIKKKQRFIGPLLSWSWESVTKEDHKTYFPSEYHRFTRKVVCTLGGHKYRKPLFDAFVKLAKEMPDVLFVALSNFKPEFVLPNFFQVGFIENPAAYYLNADLVITQAGHSTAMELITLGIPMLVVPDSNQVEQESNAKRLCELGVALSASYKDISINGLFAKVKYMLSENKFTKAASRISEIARNYITDKETVKVIKDYSTRIQVY